MNENVAVVLFGWVLANQAGVPLPVVPALVAAGTLAAHANTGMIVPVLVATGAALVADLLWYVVGRWRGPQALAQARGLSRRLARGIDGAERGFRAHQLSFLLGSRFLPELNPIAAGIAGATGIVLGRYLLIATASALAWALAWTGIGYAVGIAF